MKEAREGLGYDGDHRDGQHRLSGGELLGLCLGIEAEALGIQMNALDISGILRFLS